MVDEDAQTVSVFIVFTENQTNFGTIDATANITYDNAVAAGLNGIIRVDANAADTADIDNFSIKEMQTLSGQDEGNHNILLQAASGSTSVYVQGVIFSGTPTFTNTDSLHCLGAIELLNDMKKKEEECQDSEKEVKKA
mgnify:CR=1 FL=1